MPLEADGPSWRSIDRVRENAIAGQQQRGHTQTDDPKFFQHERHGARAAGGRQWCAVEDHGDAAAACHAEKRHAKVPGLFSAMLS